MFDENNKFSAASFYDSLSSDYHFVYKDWYQSIERQAKVLQQLIEKHSPIHPQTILDCSCGIGTQALGLAQLGYKIHATDISPKSIERAKLEAQKLNQLISFEVADLRNLATAIKGTFDVVISCDNSLPHLLKEEELISAGKSILSKMHEESLFIGSIRNYDVLLNDRPKSTTPIVNDINGERIITFQLWNWQENNIYVVNHFTLKKEKSDFQTILRQTKYRAYTQDEISKLFRKAGFASIKCLLPEESNFYQPIIIANK